MKNWPPGSFSTGAPSTNATTPSASGPRPSMNASETIPEVPSNCVDPELVHLLPDPHPDRGQAPEVDHVGIERLRLGQLGSEVLLVGGHAEGAEDLAAVLAEILAEVLVVAFAVVGGVVDDH